MRSRLTKLTAALTGVIAVASAGAVFAFATPTSHATSPPTAPQTQTQQGSQSAPDSSATTTENTAESATSESDGNSAAQTAACQKAGIDPNASNIQYDDQTGICTLDTGSGSQQ